jgi:RNA polymerase sigma-70 factor (ECF subfamily)
MSMSDERDEFADLMKRLRDGSEEAARELLDHYTGHILRVVRRRLSRELRSKYDSVDFVQAVWASFFADAPRQHRFDHPEALMAFLVTLAQNKVIEAVRKRLMTQRYNVNREQQFGQPSEQLAPKLRGREPTPSQAALANDEFQHMLTDLPVNYQRVLVMLREGQSHKDIARELNLNERTIRRILERLKKEPTP